MTFEQRFWAKVEKTDGCWLWTAYCGPHGYGEFNCGKRSKLAHRVAYELVLGPIPEGRELHHKCEVPACVNPNHLEPLTRKEHMRHNWRCKKKCCPHGHVLDGVNNRGGRWCRTCFRERGQRRGTVHLTRQQKAALALLSSARLRGDYPPGEVVAHPSRPGALRAYIHYTSAASLERRGLVEVRGSQLYLTDQAVAWLDDLMVAA